MTPARPLQRVLVLGGARCLWHDLASLGDHIQEYDVIAVNDAGVHYEGRIDHWCSLHPEKLVLTWIPQRPGEKDYITWGNKFYKNGIDRVTSDWGGSSGLFAVKIGIELGYDLVLLAGVPLDSQPHYHGTEQWAACFDYRRAWERNHHAIARYVRSLSGWTREKFGGLDPTDLDDQGRALVEQGETYETQSSTRKPRWVNRRSKGILRQRGR